jgi:hypothetical protein
LGTDNGKLEIYHYVPVVDMIQAIYAREDVKNELLKRKPRVANKIVSHEDSLKFNEIALFVCEPRSICLKFYVDEFEPVNCIGDSRSSYKMAGVY